LRVTRKSILHALSHDRHRKNRFKCDAKIVGWTSLDLTGKQRSLCGPKDGWSISAEKIQGYPMMKRVASLALLAGAVVMSYAANAAPNWDGPGKPRGIFGVIKNSGPLHYANGHTPAGTLTTWSSSFVDLTGHTVNFKMAGQDPASSNTDTHIKTILIPVIFVFGASNGNMTFDPTAKRTSGMGKLSVMKATQQSPLFTPGPDFVSGAIDCGGNNQYIDAFQRCNWWGHVSTNTAYHTVLDVTAVAKLKPLTINVTSAQGKVINNPFGNGVVGTMSINSFDAQLKAYLSKNNSKITPDTFPLFVSYDIYLTQGGCCIGGYHSAAASQSYGYSTYVDSAGAFSEDMSALSHEVAEWMDDPFTNNHVNCNDNSILEVGDPLETLPEYGTFPVKVGKHTWHPQEMAMMPYFGAPTSTSANGWTSMHNSITNVCPGQ
jgi:hypothetical protein